MIHTQFLNLELSIRLPRHINFQHHTLGAQKPNIVTFVNVSKLHSVQQKSSA
jgi:hypothetical protein